MNCPKCSAVVEPAALTAPSPGETARAILTDWRVWAVAVAVNVAAGVASGVLHLGAGAQAGAGAAGGLYIVLRMRTLRKCPKCLEVSHFPQAHPPTAPKAG